MDIQTLGDSISNFNGLAVCIVNSETYEVLYCNDMLKTIAPDVSLGVNINDIFPQFTKSGADFVIDDQDESLSLISGYNNLSTTKYSVKEAKYVLDGDLNVDCIIVVPITIADKDEELIKSVYSHLLTKDADFVVMVELERMKYFYSSAKDIPIIVDETRKEYDWDKTINHVAKEFVSDESRDLFLRYLSGNALMSSYNNGGDTQYVEYDFYTDGICTKRAARIYFTDYNDIPLSVICFKDKN